jgi:hypothetical protein
MAALIVEPRTFVPAGAGKLFCALLNDSRPQRSKRIKQQDRQDYQSFHRHPRKAWAEDTMGRSMEWGELDLDVNQDRDFGRFAIEFAQASRAWPVRSEASARRLSRGG